MVLGKEWRAGSSVLEKGKTKTTGGQTVGAGEIKERMEFWGEKNV